MPELPEVETVTRGLRELALGLSVKTVDVRHTGVIVGSCEAFAENLRGRRIQSVSRQGKVLMVELARDGDPARYLVIRLGMTGQLTIQPREAPLEPHTHVRLVLDEGEKELRFRDVRRFGNLRCLDSRELANFLARLGPDAQRATAEGFLAAMRGRRGAIKSWLMNQQALAGLGNIYADEALFEARIHPLSQPGRVAPRKALALYRAVQRVLARAVAKQGTSFRDYLDIEGRPGRFAMQLKVYQRADEPCRRCRAEIRRIVIGGRSSHFCPHCQPRPRHVAKMRGPRASAHARAAASR
ncbi:MAG: DNA-formamidopyrimidine glycosylase [Acidobacteria bacterium]|nr:MAG: DNA-formamidopyrimidine glycosylase [Acidobacteriota bacterium]